MEIHEIHSVKGINALNPRKPLKFNGSLSIVYGQNGSGKSSYVRLLKHISGTGRSTALIGNVYKEDQDPQECSFNITLNGENNDVSWTPKSGSINNLSTLQLYDTDCANVYVNEENEVTYEPWILQFFTQLTNICVIVANALKVEMGKIVLSMPSPNSEFSNTNSVIWYRKISSETSEDEIKMNCLWEEVDEIKLLKLQRQLVEVDPESKKQSLENMAKSCKQLKLLLNNHRNSLSNEACAEIIKSKLDLQNKKRAADEDAMKVFEGLPLDGVGSESWKLLWETS